LESQVILQYLVAGITTGAVYAIVALGFTSIFNSSGILNFAQGEFVMLGGLIAITLIRYGVPTPLAIVCAACIVVAVGFLLYRGLIMPRRNSPFFTSVILTISAAYIMRGAAQLLFGPYDLSLAPFTKGAYFLSGVVLNKQVLWVVGLAFLAAIVLWYFFNKTSLGKAMRAAKDNRTGAMLVGINPLTLVFIAWGISAVLGALAGIVVAPISMMSYLSGEQILFNAIAAVTIGGFGSNPGAFIGGFIIGISEQLTAGLISPLFKEAIAFLIIIVVLTWKPHGLFGRPPGSI
jgi:branched-chain amino acid transport system permease protein